MKIGITIGDCNGISHEILFKSLNGLINLAVNDEIILYGNNEVIKDWLNIFCNLKSDNAECDKFSQFCKSIKMNEYTLSAGNFNIQLINHPTDYKIEPGKISKFAGKLASDCLLSAVQDALDSKIDCLVTLPIAKESMYLTGWKYPGHTEMLAAKCGVKKPLMILFKDELRAALVTIHKPLKFIPNMITEDLVLDTIKLFNNSLINDFGIKKPKIAVLGLNPHAGENGKIGTEEKDDILPAIHQACIDGIDADGPFAADGFFAHSSHKYFDGYVAMYHDQGLIPLKILANGGGINFTAGLPIIRTSPDHGTAFSIANKCIANPQSTVDAINSAIIFAYNRMNTRS